MSIKNQSVKLVKSDKISPEKESKPKVDKTREQGDLLPEGSGGEQDIFRATMLEVVPEEKRNKVMVTLIDGLYVAYRNVTSANHNLAIKVYQFRTKSGLDHKEVASAMSLALQKSISGGYITKLFYAGHALVHCTAAKGIADIEKLSWIGHLQPATMQKLVTTNSNGLVMIGAQFAQRLNRSSLRESLAKLTSEIESVKNKPAAPWNPGAFKGAVQKALDANEHNPAFRKQLEQVMKTVQAIIDAEEAVAA